MDDPLADLPTLSSPEDSHAANGNGKPSMVDRNIFVYHNGQREVAADPIELQIRFLEVGLEEDDLYKVQKQLSEGNTADVDTEVLRKVLSSISDVFEVDKIHTDEDGNHVGLSTIELFELLADFMQFLDSLKKTVDSKLNSQQPTEQTSSESSSQTVSPTAQSANSGPAELIS
ncbi:MAG: hypothetical protein ACXABY_14905 [Candidatus Thorarchaeota archaeon]|jgi:hypothetical protein